MKIKNLFPSHSTNQIKGTHMVPFLFPDIDQSKLGPLPSIDWKEVGMLPQILREIDERPSTSKERGYIVLEQGEFWEATLITEDVFGANDRGLGWKTVRRWERTKQITDADMLSYLQYSTSREGPLGDQLRIAMGAMRDEKPLYFIISSNLSGILLDEMPAFNRPKDPPVPDEIIDHVRGRAKAVVRQVIQDYKRSPEFLSRREELYQDALREYMADNQEIIKRNRKKALDFLANEKGHRAKIERLAEEISAIRSKIRLLKARYDKEYGYEIVKG